MGCIKSVILFKATLSRAAGSLCNLCPHSKIVQLNKKINTNVPNDSVHPVWNVFTYSQWCQVMLAFWGFNLSISQSFFFNGEICVLFRIPKTLILERDVIVDSLKCTFQMVLAAQSLCELCSPPVCIGRDRRCILDWLFQNSAHEVKLNAWLDTIRRKIDHLVHEPVGSLSI